MDSIDFKSKILGLGFVVDRNYMDGAIDFIYGTDDLNIFIQYSTYDITISVDGIDHFMSGDYVRQRAYNELKSMIRAERIKKILTK